MPQCDSCGRIGGGIVFLLGWRFPSAQIGDEIRREPFRQELVLLSVEVGKEPADLVRYGLGPPCRVHRCLERAIIVEPANSEKILDLPEETLGIRSDAAERQIKYLVAEMPVPHGDVQAVIAAAVETGALAPLDEHLQ